MRITEPYTIYARTLKSGRVVYYYYYRLSDGSRSNGRSTGCESLTKARQVCKRLYNSDDLEQRKKIRFSKYARGFFSPGSLYLAWKEKTGNPIKASTLKRYNTSLKFQILPYFGNLNLQEITTLDLKKWLLWGLRKWSPKTMNNARGTLNIIFEQAVEGGLLERNPLEPVEFIKIEKKERDLLTVNEIRRIYYSGWPADVIGSAFLFAVCTGMRIGEICALKKTDIYKNYIDVYKSYSDDFGLGTTKTEYTRKVPLPADFPFAPSDSEWLFDDGNGTPLHAHRVYNAMTRKCEKIGIDCKARGITIHSLRNFFISYLQAENVPLQKIKAVVGHKDKNITEHYTYWKPEYFPEVYKAQKKLIETILK